MQQETLLNLRLHPDLGDNAILRLVAFPHQFRAGVYEKLDTINNKLENIQSTLVAGFSVVIKILNDMQNQLVSINDKMTLIYNGVSKIKQYSFISMWNSL